MPEAWQISSLQQRFNHPLLSYTSFSSAMLTPSRLDSHRVQTGASTKRVVKERMAILFGKRRRSRLDSHLLMEVAAFEASEGSMLPVRRGRSPCCSTQTMAVQSSIPPSSSASHCERAVLTCIYRPSQAKRKTGG